MQDKDNNISLDDVNAAHVGVLTAIADGEGQEAAQTTFNEVLANMATSANDRLMTEIEAHAAVVGELTTANDSIESLSANVTDLTTQLEAANTANEEAANAHLEAANELNANAETMQARIEELEEANATLSAATKPAPIDVNDNVEDGDLVPTVQLTGDQLYAKMLSKHSSN